MSWVEDVVREFGQTLGVPQLSFGRHGAARLTIERMGTLGIEHHGSEVLVYLLRQMPPGDLRFLRRALALCHYKEGHPFPLQAGMKGEEQLVFLVRIPEREFSVQTIEQSIELLDRLHAAAA